jgi:hypothetical protein
MLSSFRRSRVAFTALQALLVILLSSCISPGTIERQRLDDSFGPSRVELRANPVNSRVSAEFLNKVRPVLEKRCVVCHACYDAACQLKLTSAEGIERGASKQAIYTPRVFDDNPTRLHLDEHSTSAWRSRGFYPILNEREQTPAANLEGSLMYRALAHKAEHPLPVASNEPLPEGQRLTGLKERDHCPTVAEYSAYAATRPTAGMPYFLPQIPEHEAETLKNWLANGAQMPEPASEPAHAHAIGRWETRLNGSSNKERLIARYIYEHLFLAHLHFDELIGNGQMWYRLVRSSTPPGEPVQPIATRLPFDNPGTELFWYRLWMDPETVVAKSHLPWALNPERMEWLNDLFFDADFTVDTLPSYKARVASNPFLAFEQLPVRSRYRFLLENARFTIMGFIKGPVCRGQFSLNAIRDHFWVVFVDPESPLVGDADRFLADQATTLEFPSGREDYLNLVSVAGRHTKNNQRYNAARAQAIIKADTAGNGLSMQSLWDGDGHNPNAALTVFRHYDSASVVSGLVGESPATGWLLDYPLLERIHYLLVAGFDVFGSVGHQLSTRLFMEFLRQDAENAYLTLLPAHVRQGVLDSWYRNADTDVHVRMQASVAQLDEVGGLPISGPDYTADLQLALHEQFEPVLDDHLSLEHPNVPPGQRRALQRLTSVNGLQLSEFPEVALLSVQSADDTLRVYTVLRHVAHAHKTDVYDERKTLSKEEDTLDVLRGVVGDYPSVFWHVDESDLERLVDTASSMDSPAAYSAFLNTYGIRRSHQDFWNHADRVHDYHAAAQPIDGGLLDFNRLENR